MDDSVRLLVFAVYAVCAYALLCVIATRGALTTLMGAIMLGSLFGVLSYFSAGLPAELAIAFGAVSVIYLWLSVVLLRRASRVLRGERRPLGRTSFRR